MKSAVVMGKWGLAGGGQGEKRGSFAGDRVYERNTGCAPVVDVKNVLSRRDTSAIVSLMAR